MNTNLDSLPSADEVKLASTRVTEELFETQLYIPEMNCGSCINKIETQLSTLDSVHKVRANLTKKRVCVQWYVSQSPQAILNAISGLGFTATLVDSVDNQRSSEINLMLRAVAVAGFAASNIMLLSIAVWSGADDSTRQLFHWISASIALPAIIYSGSIFFKSAWKAIRVGRTNMDVPVSVGIILSVLLGVYDTFNHHERVYFEAATMLVFFLLIGRTLDKLMRVRAEAAVNDLRALEPPGAYIVKKSGTLEFKATKDLHLGETVLVKAGNRIPVDGVIISGESCVDTAIVDGESQLKDFYPGNLVHGGTLNMSADLHINVTSTAENSFLAQMQRLVQFANSSKGVYTRIADRAARWYAPVVHTAAVIAFAMWIVLSGDFHKSLTVAISVLIITCPCALALAVPMVHVLAGSLLLKRGIIMKDGAALEKLAEVGIVVFDKTGTLTNDTPTLAETSSYTIEQLCLAQRLACEAEHPYTNALLALGPHSNSEHADSALSDSSLKVIDIPGCGLEAVIDHKKVRLGKREWAAYLETDSTAQANVTESETILSCNGKLLAEFHFNNELRKGALAAVNRLQSQLFDLSIVSGDKLAPASKTAKQLGISDVHANAMPARKVSIVQKMAKIKPVLMVGDGLNDSGAMAAAHVALAPGTAASVGRNIADFVFLQEDLGAIPDAIQIAHRARKLVRQNITLALSYNMIVLPIAFAGLVSPLIAAVAMSFSSILVVANAMRLRFEDTALESSNTRVEQINRSHAVEPI